MSEIHSQLQSVMMDWGRAYIQDDEALKRIEQILSSERRKGGGGSAPSSCSGTGASGEGPVDLTDTKAVIPGAEPATSDPARSGPVARSGKEEEELSLGLTKLATIESRLQAAERIYQRDMPNSEFAWEDSFTLERQLFDAAREVGKTFTKLRPDALATASDSEHRGRNTVI